MNIPTKFNKSACKGSHDSPCSSSINWRLVDALAGGNNQETSCVCRINPPDRELTLGMLGLCLQLHHRIHICSLMRMMRSPSRRMMIKRSLLGQVVLSIDLQLN